MLGRAAGAALGLGKSLFKGMGPTEIVARLAPDALFGVIEGTMTPGDLTDKIIAGSGAAIGGATGGLALGKLVEKDLPDLCWIWVVLLVVT